MSKKNLWIIIPAYNEAKRIRDVILKCRNFGSVVVVDDGSKDNTFEVAEECSVEVLQHIINLGKGAAMATGAEFSLRQGAKEIVFIDSDGQHDPEEIPKLVKELGKSDIVFGTRDFDENMPAMMKFGNWAITAAVKVLFNIDLKDTQCGFRAMTASAYQRIKWVSHDYSVESEMIANAGKRHLKYSEVKIKTIYADAYKGTTVLHGLKIVKDMLWWRISR